MISKGEEGKLERTEIPLHPSEHFEGCENECTSGDIESILVHNEEPNPKRSEDHVGELRR